MSLKRYVLVVTLALAVVSLFAFTAAPALASGECGCVCKSPGYWMNHPGDWPAMTLVVGGVTYTQEEAIRLMQAPTRGDKSLTMFQAVAASNLNLLAGCHACCWIRGIIDESNWWLSVFPPESGVVAKSEAWQYSHGEWLYWQLDAWNNCYL